MSKSFEPKTDEERALLDYCNRARRFLGLSEVKRLKKGVPNDACHCVIGETIGVENLGLEIDAQQDIFVEARKAKRYIKVFMCADGAAFRAAREFDRGKRPQWQLKA